MARQQWMQRFAKWHIWLGWLVGVPVVMWTVTGLIMVIKPIDEVRGNHLRQNVEELSLPPDTNIAIALPADDARPVRSVTTTMQRRQPVTAIEYIDGTIERFASDGTKLAPIGEVEARVIVGETIVGGDKIVSSQFFPADKVPFDFRRPMPVWQVILEDKTYIYVNQQTGEIAAVRTEWWRMFDFLFGLHVMDLQTREPNPNPILLVFSGLAIFGSILGCTLMFRRRKARVKASGDAN